MNYYNENDKFAAQWLRNLIAADLIPHGHVDERSIKEVQGDDLNGYTQCHFFAGIAGWSLALQMAGWPTDAPVWTGSCPCQPFSAAGKRKGNADDRHLWPEFYRLIAECRPATVFGEQVASKDGLRWLDGVFADLERSGYACGAADLCAASQGAPGIRQRLWWVANAECPGVRVPRCGADGAASSGVQREDRERQRLWTNPGASDNALADRLADASDQRSGDAGKLREKEGGGVREIPRQGDRVGLAGSCGPTHGLANADQPQLCGQPPAGEQPGDERDGQGAVRLGDACDTRLPLSEQRELSGPQRHEEGRATEQPSSAWSSCYVIGCADGTARRIGAGVLPLAYGIPVSLGRGRTWSERMAIRTARTNRTGRLRGYGNAIVPQVAAEFIRAFVEAQ